MYMGEPPVFFGEGRAGQPVNPSGTSCHLPFQRRLRGPSFTSPERGGAAHRRRRGLSPLSDSIQQKNEAGNGLVVF